MKNNLYLLLLLFITTSVIFSCNKDENKETFGLSKITVYAKFNLTGGEYYFSPLGTAYTEPGVEALAGTESLPVETEVHGRFSGLSAVDANTPDQYIVQYSALNSDNLPGTATRNVFVSNTGDLVNSLEGVYLVNCYGAGDEAYEGSYYAMIWQVAPNVYELSHAHGGRYGDGRGYGDAYLFRGATITVVDMAANNFTFTPGTAAGWGLTVTPENFVVDADSKTITFSSTLLGAYTSTVELIQVQI